MSCSTLWWLLDFIQQNYVIALEILKKIIQLFDIHGTQITIIPIKTAVKMNKIIWVNLVSLRRKWIIEKIRASIFCHALLFDAC